MKKVYTLLLLACGMLSMAQNLSRLEYFLDRDPGYGQAQTVTLPAQNQVSGLPVSFALPANLSPGIHVMGYRTKMAAGPWSQTNFITFQTADSTAPITLESVAYFWDKDPGFGNEAYIPLAENPQIQTVEIPIATDFEPGSYRLFMRTKDSNGRYSQTNFKLELVVVAVLALADFEQNQIALYPNPVAGNLHVKLADGSRARMALFDSSGKRVFESTTSGGSMDVSHLSAGVYTAQVQVADDRVYVTKIIKQ